MTNNILSVRQVLKCVFKLFLSVKNTFFVTEVNTNKNKQHFFSINYDFDL